ncbi:MAG: adenosylcobinamide-GDP ribazoletransferase [Dehalococcoidia bacterium]
MKADASRTATGVAGFPSLLVAIEFLTVVPVRRSRPASSPPSSDEAARAQLWYPAVGLAIGGCMVGLDHVLTGRLPAGPTAALLLIVLCGLPGLLHLDGLADAADGLLSLNSPERRLEIMRDSRTGAFGVAATGLALLLTFSAIESLHGPARTPTLLVAPVAGRAAMVLLLGLVPYARSDGLAAGFTAVSRSWIGAVALISALALCGLAAGAGGLLLLGCAFVVAVGVGAFSRARAGGITGDVIGAVCVLAEVAALVAASGLQSRVWLRPWL